MADEHLLIFAHGCISKSRKPGNEHQGQQCASQSENREVVVQRAAVIHHHTRDAVWAQHTMEFANSTLRVGRMMDDAEAVDQIEALVLEWELCNASLNEAPRKPTNFETSPRKIERKIALVESRIARAVPRELRAVRSDSTPSLQHVAPSPLGKIRERWDVRLTPVPLLFYLAKELHCSRNFPRREKTGLVNRPIVRYVRRNHARRVVEEAHI